MPVVTSRMEWEPRTCGCVLIYELTRDSLLVHGEVSAELVEAVEVCDAHSAFLGDPDIDTDDDLEGLEAAIAAENETLGKAYAAILEYLGERLPISRGPGAPSSTPGLVAWGINSSTRKVEITVKLGSDETDNDDLATALTDIGVNLDVTYADTGTNGTREQRTVFDDARTDGARRIFDGARQRFNGFNDQANLHQAWDQFFSICGGTVLETKDTSQLSVDFGSTAALDATKHVINFSHTRDNWRVAIDANHRDKPVNMVVQKNGIDTALLLHVKAYRIGIFRSLEEADFTVDEVETEHSVVGYSWSDAITGFPVVVTPNRHLGAVNFRWTTSELLCDSRRHVPYSARSPVAVENDGVPPPAFLPLPISGALNHYRSTVNTSPGDDRQGLEDGELPVQALMRTGGTLSYYQGAWEPTERGALMGLRVNAEPDANWDTPPFPHVPATAAESPFLTFKYKINDADTAELESGDFVSHVAFDQPVGTGSTTLYSLGINWRAAAGERKWDVFVQEDYSDSIDYEGHPRDEAFEYWGGTEWFASALGPYHPRTREQLEAMPLGWGDIETFCSFDLQFSRLRAYLDTNRLIPVETLSINLVKNNGFYGDLRVRVNDSADRVGTTDWYEDDAHTESVLAGVGFCLRFRPSDSVIVRAMAHISMIAYSVRDTPANRGCLVRVLPEATAVSALPCGTRLARAVKITRTDGEVFAYTEHDRPLEYDGTTYKSCAGFQGSASELGAISGEVGNMEIRGFSRDLNITKADLFAGKFDGATVEVWLLPWGDDYGVQPARQIGGGTIGKTQQEGIAFTLEALSPSAYMKQKPLLEVVTPTCRFEFGSVRCGVASESMRVTGTVTSVAESVGDAGTESRRQFTDSSRTEDAEFFAEGVVTWASGDNAGMESKVKVFDGGEFVLWEPLPYPIQTTDEYSAVPGCDKLAATCKTKFDNYINFGGFEHVPGLDKASESPSGRMGE